MIRQHWRDPGFWPWWWRNRVSADSKIALAFVAACVLGFAGYFAARGPTGLLTVSAAQGADAPTSALVAAVRTSTVQQVVTIREPSTVVMNAPRDLRRTVTVNEPARTVVLTQVVEAPPVTLVRTSEQVVTAERVVTRERVITRPVTTTRVVTEQVPVTQTVHSRQTVQVTQTVPVTVPVTVTVTVEKKKGKGKDDDDDDDD